MIWQKHKGLQITLSIIPWLLIGAAALILWNDAFRINRPLFPHQWLLPIVVFCWRAVLAQHESALKKWLWAGFPFFVSLVFEWWIYEAEFELRKSYSSQSTNHYEIMCLALLATVLAWIIFSPKDKILGAESIWKWRILALVVAVIFSQREIRHAYQIVFKNVESGGLEQFNEVQSTLVWASFGVDIAFVVCALLPLIVWRLPGIFHESK